MDFVEVRDQHLSGPGSVPRVRRWPWFVWFLLRFTSLFNSRRVVTARRCNLCRLPTLGCDHHRAVNEENPAGTSLHIYPGGVVDTEGLTRDGDNESTDPRLDDPCKVCQMEWANGRGRYQPYAEADIGVRRWNHRGSTALSAVWSLLLIALLLSDFFTFLYKFWGHQKQINYLISYSTFLVFNLFFPFLSLVGLATARMYRLQLVEGRLAWYRTLSVGAIVKCLQYLDMGEHGLPYRLYLLMCLLWPFANGVHRMVIYFVLDHKDVNYHIYLSLITGLLGMLVYGAFCYLLSLLRLSFERRQHIELAFLWRRSGDLDVCRRRLAIYADELGSMCRLVSILVIFVLTISSWKFTTQIRWNYSQIVLNPDNTTEFNFNFTIWSEIFMFLVLPLVAVGGVSMNGMWVQFRRSISQMRSEATDAFWDKLMTICNEQSPVYKVKMLTILFSALGLLIGLKSNAFDAGAGNANYTTQATLIAALSNERFL